MCAMCMSGACEVQKRDVRYPETGKDVNHLVSAGK